MTNPQRKKGTAAESALMHDLAILTGRDFRRTAAGTRWDIESINNMETSIIRILATRPDRGRWLLTMSLVDWATLDIARSEIRVEVKRYKSFAHHTIWEEKFGD